MRRQTWIAIWAVLFIAATFVEAIVRLGARAAVELSGTLTPEQWLAFGALTITMTYYEGYRALQCRFAPSVAARSLEVGERAGRRWAILAPFYAVSLVGAPPRVIARSALGIVLIVVCVVLVRALPTPWRGIVDGAVAIALAWGLVCLVASFAAALVYPSAARVE